MKPKNTISRFAAALIAVASYEAVADCNPLIPSNIEASRYKVVTVNSVEDTVTGLIWLRCPLGYSWSQAAATCTEMIDEPSSYTWTEALNTAAGKGDGWRLPNSKELETLVKRNCYNPAIETSVFSNVGVGFMWSATPASAYFGNAWAIQFRNGGVVSVDKKSAYSVRLVKDSE